MNSICRRAYCVLAPIIACGLPLAACGLPLAANPDPARFDAEIRAFESWDAQNSYPVDAVLFAGSSSIRLWQTAESFPDLPVINRGFGGSHISDVNHFAHRVVLKYKPRTIVFYAGDNDIAAGKSPQQVFDDFRSFAKLVHDRLPNARIIYLPIKPSIARWNLWPQMQQANALVKSFADRDQSVDYVDTATPMLNDEQAPRKDIFLNDGLHMNEKGYGVWTTTLTPILDKARANAK
jgi:lysophospholipase L1-like esterase